MTTARRPSRAAARRFRDVLHAIRYSMRQSSLTEASSEPEAM